MAITISNKDLCLPVSPMFALYITDLISKHDTSQAITLNFRDPNYSVESGGYHPVEIRLEKEYEQWHFSYITDYCYVGTSYMAELVKDLDFDFGSGVFQNMYGIYPLEQATDMYQIWEQNFIYYATISKVFDISITEG